jgi:hypothetical protein
MTEKVSPLNRKSLDILVKSIHFVLSTIILFALAYLLGHTMLDGKLFGNDSPMHVSYALWLDRYFPDIPHWFALQGGGESLLHGYPIFSHLIVVLLHRISGFTILQSYRLISFLAFPLSALGIYLFCWTVLKKQTIGLIAAVFYLLAPVTWTWMYHWGFFAQQVGMVFLPFTLISFERTFHHQLEKQQTGKRRIWLIVLILFVLLASFSHMLIGAAAGMGMLLYTIFTLLTAPASDRGKVFSSGMRVLFLVVVIVGMIAAFYFVPFYIYGGIANREGLNNPVTSQLHRLPVKTFFGLSPIDPREVLTRMQFPLIEVIFTILGTILAVIAFRRSDVEAREPLVWSISGFIATIYVLTPALPSLVLRISSLLFQFINFRSLLLLVMIIMPMMTGYGIWALAHSFLYPEKLLGQERSKPGTQKSFVLLLQSALVPILALLITWASIIPLGALLSSESWALSYGHLSVVDLRDIWQERAPDSCISQTQDPRRTALCSVPEARTKLNIEEFLRECDRLQDYGLTVPDLCNETNPTADMVISFLDQCDGSTNRTEEWMSICAARVDSLIKQLTIMRWPAFQLESQDPQILDSLRMASLLPEASMLRFDVSPYHGRLAEDLPIYSGGSQIESYTQQLSLVHLMWGYQLGIFYSDEYGSPNAINNLADWMGIEYVFLDPTRDPVDKYGESTWSSIYEGVIFGDRDILVLKNLTEPEFVTLSNKPVILVIGALEKGVYADVFNLAIEGQALYDDYILVEGEGQVDQYTLEELRNFDILLLHGYEYKKDKKAWQLLQDYVSSGGALFIDTGWEYQIPEWEFSQAPSVLPISQSSWTNYGKVTQYELAQSSITEGINPALFDPLIWEDDPWSVSGTDENSIRDWGTAILRVQEHPLIVSGEFDHGRVVWSGMNLISHLIAYDNEEEAKLLHQLFNWLKGSKEGTEIRPPLVEREHPDVVNFTITNPQGGKSWLYWREAYYTNWHAYLRDATGEQEIPIYRGGPGFMLMPIETSSEEVSVTLRWESSVIESASIVVSILGVLFLIGIAIDGLFLGGQGLTWIKIAFTTRLPRPFLDEKTHRDAHKKPLRVKDILPASTQDIHAGEKESFDDTPLENHFNDEDEALMKSWLEDRDNEDDPWVNKMLDPNQRK